MMSDGQQLIELGELENLNKLLDYAISCGWPGHLLFFYQGKLHAIAVKDVYFRDGKIVGYEVNSFRPVLKQEIDMFKNNVKNDFYLQDKIQFKGDHNEGS
jgi:hypothetical protein